jgi:predicted kinase
VTTLTITRGLPGAGKTTWARQFAAETGAVRVNRDDMRMMLYGRKVDLGHDQEKAVSDACHGLVTQHLRAGRNVVTDDTNLRPVYVREWRKIATASGAEFLVHECPILTVEAIERQASRPEGDRVPADVIARMAGKYLQRGAFLSVPDEVASDAAPEAYQRPPDAPSVVLCDIDGTVALMGNRSPYDTTSVSDDLPNWPVLLLLGRLEDEVIFMSGRDASCRTATHEWLGRFGWGDSEVFMRPAGDRRRDSIVKRELFDQHIRYQYNVRFVLDDRTQVVQMWRSLGLTCLQVADGDF